METKCDRCFVVFEPKTPTVMLGQYLLHVACAELVKRKLDCPYGCGPRKYYGADSFTCISDHK